MLLGVYLCCTLVQQALHSHALLFPASDELLYNSPGLSDLAEYAQVALQSTPVRESHWPRVSQSVGAVVGVDVDTADNPIILHRGPAVWTTSSFNSTRHYQHASRGPVREPLLLTLGRVNGAVTRSEAANLLYLPHGLHVDAAGNRWLTDLALHQVLKLPPNSDTPSLRLGVAFEPGSDGQHFCQPTAVAIAPDGSVLVADGYCNSRVAVFSADGRFQTQLGVEDGVLMSVPHDLLVYDHVICVSDRENGRLIGWRLDDLSAPPQVIDLAQFGRLFSAAVADGVVYTVHQSLEGATAVSVDLATGIVLNTWGDTQGLVCPHAIASSHDESALYIAETSPARVSKFLIDPAFQDSVVQQRRFPTA